MTIRLTGTLRCATKEDAQLVSNYLPAHVALTCAEPGCLMFEVTPTEDPLVWQVREEFTDRDAFELHQRRVQASAWGKATSHIARDYHVTDLP
ncbi:putative quinol monooxygenase [Corynebacterium hindlerae]|uniref:putative quinol monooxygenase n=1 Tax=Corynebacterium hindlerae TaxID=699041 RepID=UPI001FCBC9A7|nr:antibiotic biosynthesis monooxygenase [Corynebacterium hindlerae]